MTTNADAVCTRPVAFFGRNSSEGTSVAKRPVYDEPSNVEAVDGVVKVDGPDDVHVDLTPNAALETSDRLLDGAQDARGQQLLAERGHKGPSKKS